MNLRRTAFGVAVLLDDGSELPIRQIVCIGKNYVEHAKEQAAEVPTRPMYFTKNLRALALDGDDIVIPKVCQDRPQVDYEAELAVIIGAEVKDVPAAAALDCVLGYCAADDVSARWWQKDGSGGQFFRGKSFDGFAPLGPRVVPRRDLPDPQALRIVCRVNGEERQNASTADMVFSVAHLIADLSRGTTLVPGTVILTGTPGGVGFARKPPIFLAAGDRVEVEIEKIGVLANRVRAE